MPAGSFSKYVSGFTSDHTYQTATAVSYTSDGTPLSLTGMTWNLLNKATAKSPERTYSNNPFDVDEFEQYYQLRKRNQLRFLGHQIRTGSIDYIVLQEVDIFTKDPLLPFVKEFLDYVRNTGWQIVHTEKSDEVRMPLVILYDSRKLSFVSKRAVFSVAGSSKKTALEATFNYNGTNAQVCITNMHLDYNTDHRQEIIEYQKQQIAENKFTIIGGDANHSQSKEYYSLVGDLDIATNISIPSEGEVASDEGGKCLKRLDGFMVSPANAAVRVEITEGSGAYFRWIPANTLIQKIKARAGNTQPLGKYVCRLINPSKEHVSHVVHMSMPGLPWIRDPFKYLLIGNAGSTTS